MTPEQEQAKADLELIERQIRETQTDERFPLPWRVSMRGNIIAANEQLVLRPQGADKRERRKRGWVLANAANAVGAQVTAEQADRLTAARLRWAEVQPAEPGFIEVNGHRYPLADRHRVTTHEVAAALNEGAAAGMRAAVRDNIVVLTFNNGPATVQARTIIPDIVTPFAGFEFGFVAQQVRQ